jgi:membrane-bound serine protease (ClpP class)
LLVVGVVPFFFAVRKFKQWYWLLPAIISAVVGSVFLFRAEAGSPAINPIFAVIVSVVSILLMWLIGIKSIEALRLNPAQDLGALLEKTGEARTEIHLEGTVYVSGEEWTARSEKRIPVGSQVKVTGREGLVLIVEQVK